MVVEAAGHHGAYSVVNHRNDVDVKVLRDEETRRLSDVIHNNTKQQQQRLTSNTYYNKNIKTTKNSSCSKVLFSS